MPNWASLNITRLQPIEFKCSTVCPVPFIVFAKDQYHTLKEKCIEWCRFVSSLLLAKELCPFLRPACRFTMLRHASAVRVWGGARPRHGSKLEGAYTWKRHLVPSASGIVGRFHGNPSVRYFELAARASRVAGAHSSIRKSARILLSPMSRPPPAHQAPGKARDTENMNRVSRKRAGSLAGPRPRTSGVGRQFSRFDIADRAEGVAAKVAVIRRSRLFARDGNLCRKRAWQFVTSRRTGGSLPRPGPWRSRKSAGMCRVAAGPPAGTEGRCPGLPSPGTALQGS